jgi:hypothetical protein
VNPDSSLYAFKRKNVMQLDFVNTFKRRNLMNKRVGLWLDRNKAVIVSITDSGEERKRITSDMEHYRLYSSVVPGDGLPENIRDRRYWDHLGEYYDNIITYIQDAKAIQIFGPGEAKYELKKHLECKGLSEYIVSVEEAEKLTDEQIGMKVDERFTA